MNEEISIDEEMVLETESVFSKDDSDYASKPSIKWNFTKFLVDKEGNIVKRFEPTSLKEEIDSYIEKLL